MPWLEWMGDMLLPATLGRRKTRRPEKLVAICSEARDASPISHGPERVRGRQTLSPEHQTTRTHARTRAHTYTHKEHNSKNDRGGQREPRGGGVGGGVRQGRSLGSGAGVDGGVGREGMGKNVGEACLGCRVLLSEVVVSVLVKGNREKRLWWRRA